MEELRFIVDTQLPPSLAEFFRRRGYDATHVMQYPRGILTSDSEIISIARDESGIIVSKDSDFMDYYFLKGYPPAVLLLQLGNIRNQELFMLLNKIMKQIMIFYLDGTTHFSIVRKDNILFF